ncbi:MAG: 2,3-bisphosphoglycerate-independent phosphoglycerate mutase [Candidatus Gastranaerophilales bacterium]|nr:2,3-bisphosphoglycerate-independent phosphoglycerate mutase [Candidatus Gastranaerophilales bacterium]
MFGSGIITNYSPQRSYFCNEKTTKLNQNFSAPSEIQFQGSSTGSSPPQLPFIFLMSGLNSIFPCNSGSGANSKAGFACMEGLHNSFPENQNFSTPSISFGRKVVLAILDGWGNREENNGNAIKLANPVNFNKIMTTCPTSELDAHGEHVGLPEGQLGNSEAGHSCIGGGRVVLQDITRINKSIENGDFFKNPALLKAMQNAKDNNSALHLMGLVSTNGAHSSLDHLYALINMAKQQGIKNVYVHAFLDGRDTAYQSGIEFIKKVDNKLSETGYPPVASVMGAFYAMDRDNNWSRVKEAYDCLISGTKNETDSAVKSIEKSYEAGISDEFILPTVTGDENSRIKDNDSIICFNYRADRAREITNAFTKQSISGFNREEIPKNLCYVCMTEYDEKNTLPVAFPPLESKNYLSEVLSKAGKKQHKVAETEKYAHVTFFLNGSREKPFLKETRTLVPSIKIQSYDKNPEMRAEEVTQKTIKALKNNDVVIVNYANSDMVGHTGNLEATKKAVNTVDNCLKKLVKAAKEEDATIVLTADHGNAECMIDPVTGNPFTTHTKNKVPFAVINAEDPDLQLKKTGSLIDIAPTVLDLLDIKKPEEMTGQSLILK